MFLGSQVLSVAQTAAVLLLVLVPHFAGGRLRHMRWQRHVVFTAVTWSGPESSDGTTAHSDIGIVERNMQQSVLNVRTLKVSQRSRRSYKQEIASVRERRRRGGGEGGEGGEGEGGEGEGKESSGS